MSNEKIKENEIHENSDRKKYYDELWQNTPTVQVTVDGKTQPKYFQVNYKSNTELDRLPVKEIYINSTEPTGLWYNPFNSRILAYKLKKEAELNRELSGNIKEDREYLQKILLESVFYSSEATEDLEKDLEKTGQTDPAIISADGIIWNANRRVAIRQKLFKQTGDAKWNKVEAVRLPSSSFKELKQLEHRLQMGKEFRQDYGSINLRLRCRQAIETHGREKWTMVELQNSFQSKYTKADIEKFIEEIDLIDEYLEAVKNPSNYPLLEKGNKGSGVEIFTALNDQLKWEKETNNTTESVIETIKYMGFAIIHNPQTTYRSIRNFRNILRKNITRDNLFENSLIYQNPAEYTIPENNSVVALAFKPEITETEVENLQKETAVYESIDDLPSEVSDEILKKMKAIELDKIDPEDKEFKKNAIGIIERVEVLISKCSFAKVEIEDFAVILEKLAGKFGYKLQKNS